jgi:hypothetical protein
MTLKSFEKWLTKINERGRKMQPMFTVHAGEYLVGSYVEDKFKNYKVWVPSKDTGIDLLVTDAKNSRAVSLQCVV